MWNVLLLPLLPLLLPLPPVNRSAILGPAGIMPPGFSGNSCWKYDLRISGKSTVDDTPSNEYTSCSHLNKVTHRHKQQA